MYLRELKMKDAPYMLEWMRDINVIQYLHTDFMSKTLEDCKKFIMHSIDKKESIHLAIADENDIYMGTVSLKNIMTKEKTAEFAITIRKEAMGKGYSGFGMANIIKIGFEEYRLKKIVWCVSEKNVRAVRFYNKNGYKQTDSIPEKIRDIYKEINEDLYWYEIRNDEAVQ